MRRSKRREREQISRLLGANPLPRVDDRKREALIDRLSAEACGMDYCGEESFVEKLAVQFSYLSPGVFLLQGGILAAVLYYAWEGDRWMILSLAMCFAPLMAGVLLYELGRTFGCKVWEMESVCRYNLPQLFFLRLCILSGGDFIVLGTALTAFCMRGGRLWQFNLCVLLPFFLGSALCMYFLQDNRKRCICLVLFCLGSLAEGFGVNLYSIVKDEYARYSAGELAGEVLRGGNGTLAKTYLAGTEPVRIYEWFLERSAGGLESGVLDWICAGALAAALVLFFLSAARLCRKKYYVSAMAR